MINKLITTTSLVVGCFFLTSSIKAASYDDGSYDAGYKAGYEAALKEQKKSDSHNYKNEKELEQDSLVDTFAKGRAYIDARYRYEHVDQTGFAKDARASTIRTRLGYETAKFKDFQGLIEFEDVTLIGAENYNSTTNGRTAFPVVADPEGTELNQAYLTFSGIPNTVLKAGRHRLVLDNARFVGDVGWRQNNQTHDGATITNTYFPDTKIFYGYSYNINRIFGNDHPVGDFNSDIHMFNVSYTGLPIVGKIVAYAYLLGLDNAAALSSDTYGVSLKNKVKVNDEFNFLYHLEYAHQSDYDNNPVNYDANYYLIEPGISKGNFTLKAGYEVLESDSGTIAFSTPLATLHKFNGWSDRFLATPATGLEDLYAGVWYKITDLNEYIDGTKLALIYHDFSPETGGGDYGDEWNFEMVKTFNDHYTLGFKYANYDADTFSVDTEKFIFTFGVKFSQ